MKLIYGLVALLALVGLAACGDEQKSPVPPAVATTTAAITVTGSGSTTSAPFRVGSSGTYKAYVKASKSKDGANDPSACPFQARLISGQSDIGYFKTLTEDTSTSADKPGTLETRPFRLEAQKYAVTAATACEWQVLLERQLSK